jgi:hypothetical protein
MDKKYWWFLAGIVAGVVFAPQVRKIPGVNKLPTV